MSTYSKLIVALDIGTSSTRALLYDVHGNMIPGREVKAEYSQRLTSDGGVECDPAQLLKLTLGAVKKLMNLTTPQERSRIVAVGASCFWHALMGIDSDGDAVTPVYSWADTRAYAAANDLKASFDKDAYHQTTGAFFHPCFWPAKIVWLTKSNPTLVSKVAKWISFPDYIALKVGGNCKTSISIASGTGLFNRQASVWDTVLCSKLDIDIKTLPEIASDLDTFTCTDSKLIGKLPDVPWYFALGDGACSNLGAGGTSDKRLVVNVSTSGAARFITTGAGDKLPDGLFDYRLDKTRHVIGGAISNGGNVFAWLCKTLDIPAGQGLEKALRQAKPCAHGLTVLPFWAGERSPGWHANAKASILGMSLSTAPLDIAQATLESLAYTIRQIRDMIAATYPQASDVIVSGGAVEPSRYMQQLLADVLGSSVRVSLDGEPSGRGAVLAVSERIGELKSIDAAKDELSRKIEPRLDAVKSYDEEYERYKGWYEKLID